jgi:hypothetical protein
MCSFIIKLTLSQISLILAEFIYFIFTIINKYTFINTDTTFTTKHTNLSKSTPVPWQNLSVSPLNYSLFSFFFLFLGGGGLGLIIIKCEIEF